MLHTETMMAFGYVSRVMSDRGIGFVVQDGQSNEVEFHWTSLAAGRMEQLVPGQRVQFDTQLDHRDKDRTRAVNVRLLGESA